MADHHKRKATEPDSSIEIIPPPSTQPPAPKEARHSILTSIPTTLRPVFLPGHSSSAKHNTISKSRHRQTSAQVQSNNTVGYRSTKAAGKAKAKPTAAADSDHDSDHDSDPNGDSDNNHVSDSSPSNGDSDKKVLTKPSTSSTSSAAFQFKGFLMSQIKADKGAAHKETNSQGGKGPSARATAASRNKKNPADVVPQPRTVNTDSFRARVVMILPYGVRPAPLDSRNRYNSPFNIRKNPFWSKEMGFLSSKGFAVRSSDPEGFVFDVHWSEEQFFQHIYSILPKAAETMINNHNEAKNGPCVWLPCVKAAYTGKFFVHPADGPYSGALMQDISGLAANTRRCDENDGVFIVSTTKISLGHDDVDSDYQDEDVPMVNTSASSSSSTSRRPAKSVSVSASCDLRQPAPAVAKKSKKKVEVIDVTNDESDSASTGSPSGDTEPAASRAATPAVDLDQSFSDLIFSQNILDIVTHFANIFQNPIEQTFV
ncbi:hypothetical protein BJ165DRAFT_1535000 [Panaeolus papilionaceus]|nr:hypothetical protein BJ165DRAFT_1535000 [Panaeolus papilionaceus]